MSSESFKFTNLYLAPIVLKARLDILTPRYARVHQHLAAPHQKRLFLKRKRPIRQQKNN
jgi:hypothetical protein